MLINRLIYEYARAHYALRKQGVKQKLIFLGFGFIASIIAAWKIITYTGRIEHFFPFLILAFIIFILVISTIKSTSLVSNRKLLFLRNNFKADFAKCVTDEIPEIHSFKFNMRIHPSVFIHSGLFKKKFSDYQGDDYVIGNYKQMKFELSELHVLQTFRVLFSGFFAHLVNTQDFKVDEGGNLPLIHDTKKLILDFEEKHHAKIQIKTAKNQMYITFEMKGEYFESTDFETIAKLQMDLGQLKEMIEIIKSITDHLLENK